MTLQVGSGEDATAPCVVTGQGVMCRCKRHAKITLLLGGVLCCKTPPVAVTPGLKLHRMLLRCFANTHARRCATAPETARTWVEVEQRKAVQHVAERARPHFVKVAPHCGTDGMQQLHAWRGQTRRQESVTELLESATLQR